jgi:glycosyltransferase involved in cell wall biosynthesis
VYLWEKERKKMRKTPPISITVLLKNGERTLEKTLQSLALFDEVLVYDTGSTDKSLEIAKNFTNVRIEQGEFVGFGKTHNIASSLAKHDWILSIDSDEEVSKELFEEICSLPLDPQTVWRIRRENFLFGKHITYAGWADDYPVRLYNRKKSSFSNDAVHEKVLTEGLNVATLKGRCFHTSYLDLADFERKAKHYSTLFAEQNKGKHSSPGKAALHAFAAFFRCYLLQRGILGGFWGFFLSFYSAKVCLYKYLKLWESNLQKSV